MRTAVGPAALVAAVLVLGAAHIGSPDAWYEGPAGPYRVLVHIEAPGVIPGIAVVNVRVTGDGVRRVTAQGNRFDATGGAPPPELATPVHGNAGWYRTSLWMMTSGSNSVTVAVSGSRGDGSVVVPLVAVATRRLGFDRGLGFVLGALGLFLFAGLLTIVGAAVREGVLSPGEEPDARRRRLAWRARGGVAVLLGLLLFGGWRWWSAEDELFVRSMFRPMASEASVGTDSSGHVLILSIRDSVWIRRNDPTWLRTRGATRRSPLLPDHGKLMHLFLIAENGRAFAHLHPMTGDSIRFTSPLPELPAGRYRAFGDIVHESGLAQTLVASVAIPAPAPMRRPVTRRGDVDDASAVRDSVGGGPDAMLEDGSTLHWLRDWPPLRAGEDASLRFVVRAPDGTPAVLESYMGMRGHAVVVRDDGGVFIHLHPLGTISMAAQMSFVMRQPSDSITGRLAMRMARDATEQHGAMPDTGLPPSDTLSFPYAFPRAGSYQVWVQVKRGGRVLTGAFAAPVVDQTK